MADEKTTAAEARAEAREKAEDEQKARDERLDRWAAVVAISFAVLAGMGDIRAGGLDNDALGRKAEAGRVATEMANQWAFYQAKSTKEAIYRSQIQTFDAMKMPPAAYGNIRKKVEEYASEKKVIEGDARKAKDELDKLNAESEAMASAGASMDYAVGLAQIAMAVVALVVLTHQGWLLIAGSVMFLPCAYFIINSYMMWVKY